MSAMRADALRNRDRILEVARAVIAEQGAQASLRDIARRAGVGMGTLYRHFPNREALLEALLRRRFDELAALAESLADDPRPAKTVLRTWLAEFGADAGTYRGLSTTLLATLDDPGSPLHASCQAMRTAGAGLLRRAQQTGDIRGDVDGTDLFALVSAVAWIADQSPALAYRRDHLFELVMAGLAARTAP